MSPSRTSGLGDLGNDQYGDCGVAGLEHLLESDAADANETESFPSDQQAIAFYLQYTGGQDSGVVLSQYLTYVRTNGYYGHTVAAFAPVSVHDVPVLQAAIYLYDGAYTGIAVTQAMMDAFGQGEPWTLEMAQGEPLGGHCIPLVAYDGQYLYAITWGGIQKIEYAAWHAISSEAWAVISGELADGDGHGVNLAALQADLDELDVPAPAPAPRQPPATPRICWRRSLRPSGPSSPRRRKTSLNCSPSWQATAFEEVTGHQHSKNGEQAARL